MISNIMQALRSSVCHRVWIISDLQQSDPLRARACLTLAIDDFKQLDFKCEQIWYLGDAVEGENLDMVHEMAAMHLELLKPLGIPLRYIMGNHDLDVLQYNKDSNPNDAFPFYQAIQTVPEWKSTSTLQSFYFLDKLGDYVVVFLSDHCGEKGDWFTTHGQIHGDKYAYPYSESDYKQLSKTIGEIGKPVILAGHYAFSGGNRPSELLDQMLPLPTNVRIHFHGHAHIGDSEWAGKDCYQKISFVQRQPIPQINVSSLENIRGDHIRSVMFEIYDNGSMGIYFREHDRNMWADMYLIESP